MHGTAGFRVSYILDATGPPPVMCSVRHHRVCHYYERTRDAKEEEEEEAFVRWLHDFDVIRERHGWSLRHRLLSDMR